MKKRYTLFNVSLISLLLIMILSAGTYAQRSKVQGKVKDKETGEALIGANVILLNTSMGAASDVDGNYYIINVPPGKYQVQASMVGYAKEIVTDVIVSPDRVTTINFDLSSDIIQGQEIIVTADKNVLHKEVSGTQIVITDDQIKSVAGVREISTYLEMQPGVTLENGFISIRGGSADQTGTFINGMSYNNAAVGNAETNIPISAIDQVSLLSGGFNAEYGNFRSGLINVTTKSGSKDAYHGSATVTANIPHLKRFGSTLTDPYGSGLRPYLDPSVAFTGTEAAWKDDKYLQGQYDKFGGWNALAENFNTQNPTLHASPYDYYLLGAWMHMAEPDYAGLAALPEDVKQQIGYYELTEQQKQLFEDHKRKEEGMDYNIDVGFGGPVPFASRALGDATFYLSHTSKRKYYIVPVVKDYDMSHVTLGTLRTQPLNNLTFTLNFLWKRQLGVSPIKPAFGDFPDATREGGFMREDNLKNFTELKSLDGGANYMYDPEIFPMLDQTTIMGGINVNHVISPTTFWEASIRYSRAKDHSPTGDNRDQTVLTTFGPFPVTEMPYGKRQYSTNRVIYVVDGDTLANMNYPAYDGIPGVMRRFRSKEGDLYTNVTTNQISGKADFVTQIGEHHYIKSGFEYNMYDINHLMWHKWNDNAYNTYEYNYHRYPSQTGFYAQDQITYEGIVANLGVRFDYYYGGGGKWPTGDPYSVDAFYNSPFKELAAGAAADSFYNLLSSGKSLIWDLWEQYDREHPGFLQPVKNHFSISPRLGLSFPVTENSKFYFNYSHFRSQPPYYSMYLIRYRYTKNGLYNLSNPNMEPPRTISYELGIQYNFYENMILSLSGYYKDVTGEDGDITYRNSSNLVNYDSYANNNYEDIQGLEINISKSDNSWINGWVNFNYMMKKSGYIGLSELTETGINSELGSYYDGNESRFLPQPRFTSNISLRTMSDWFNSNLMQTLLGNWQLSFSTEWRAGKYFTFNPNDVPYMNNNLQWPDYYMVDARISKTLNVAGLNTTFYVDINNIFNFKVDLLNYEYAFRDDDDRDDYVASLHLPIYNDPSFESLRTQSNGELYVPGNDKLGDLRSSSKPYINDPNYSYFIYGKPRSIWFGAKVDF